MANNSKRITPVPIASSYPGQTFLILIILFSLIGLAVAGYLEFIGIALAKGEILGGAACSGSDSTFNCHAVAASPYAKVFGIPLVLFGILGYLSVLVLATTGIFAKDNQQKYLGFIFLLSASFLIVDGYLLHAMIFKVGSICKLCIFTYVINLAILASAFLAHPKPRRPNIAASIQFFRTPQTQTVFVGSVVLVGALGLAGVYLTSKYLTQGMSEAQVLEMAQKVKLEELVTVDISRAPIRGNKDAPIQIVQFSDFMCPACQRAAQFNQILEGAYRDQINIVFKHFPLDKSCNDHIQFGPHPSACQVAAASVCVNEQGKFWEFHDLVYKDKNYNIAGLDQDLIKMGIDRPKFDECVASGRALELIKSDTQDAAKIGVNSTPTYIVNGVPVRGILTPNSFSELLPGFLEVKKRASSKK